MPGKYDSIIDLPHHVSVTRPHMSRVNRAAQFSPFAALSGYEDAVRETERLTDSGILPDEERQAGLDRKQLILREKIAQRPMVTFTYFLPDSRKEGGSYVTVSGRVRRIDDYERMVCLADGSRIPLDSILDMESNLFE